MSNQQYESSLHDPCCACGKTGTKKRRCSYCAQLNCINCFFSKCRQECKIKICRLCSPTQPSCDCNKYSTDTEVLQKESIIHLNETKSKGWIKIKW